MFQLSQKSEYPESNKVSMKNSSEKESKKQEKAKAEPKDQVKDEMAEMESFLRKKRLQNHILKKATQK